MMELDPQAFFTESRNILDAHHDRRERIIKASRYDSGMPADTLYGKLRQHRDITALSKKMIFALHRAIQANNSNPNYKEADQRQKEIIALFKKLAGDIQGLHYHRYSRSFSGGFEEFIEAIAFYHFLIHKTVITKEQVDGYFKDEQGHMWVPVKPEDYILGLADFTGELMRYAIHVVSTGKYDQAMVICKLLRKIDLDFDMIATSYMPQLSKKLGTLKGSIKKVEQACYTFQIRGSEYPKEMYLTIIKNHQDQYEQEQHS